MNLGEYYRTHGETAPLRDVEATLTTGWKTRTQIAEESGRSFSYVVKALQYLVEEGRAQGVRQYAEGDRWARWRFRLPR